MKPTVAIVLATYNGAKFLSSQLNSIADQVGVEWELWASDDGSTDQTRAILHNFARRHAGRVHITTKDRCGPAGNFLTTLAAVDTNPDFFAFCDQDDIWMPSKLYWATKMLDQGARPELYCGPQIFCDENLRILGRRAPPIGELSFGNALVQNVVSGNTTVLNRSAAHLLNAHANDTLIHHDWWSYLLVTGAGGRVHFDPIPRILYRRHADNIIGANKGMGALIDRIQRLSNGDQAQAMFAQTEVISTSSALTPVARKQLQTWRTIHDIPPKDRAGELARACISRHSAMEQRLFNIALRAGYFDPKAMVPGTPRAICKAA